MRRDTMCRFKKFLFMFIGLSLITISCESEEKKQKREDLEKAMKAMKEYDKQKGNYEKEKKKHEEK